MELEKNCIEREENSQTIIDVETRTLAKGSRFKKQNT